MLSSALGKFGRHATILKNVGWLSGANLLVKPAWFIFITFSCARVLGANGYGVLTTALSLTSLVYATSSFGLTTYTLQQVAADRNRAATFFVNLTLLRCVLIIIAGAVALLVAKILAYDQVLTAAVVFACFYQGGLSLTEYVRSYFQVYERLQHQAATVVGEKVLVIALGGTALYATGSAPATIVGMAIGMALTAVATTVWTGRKYSLFAQGAFSWSFIRTASRKALPFGLAGVLGMAYFRIDTIMVESLLGTMEAGQYGLAFRVVEALNMLPIMIVHAVVYPRLSRFFAGRHVREMTSLLKATVLGLGGASVAVAVPLFFASGSVIHFLSGHEDLYPAADALRILTLVYPLTCLRVVGLVALLSSEDEQFVAKALGVAVALNVTLNLLLIPSLGINGAATATMLSETVLLVVYAYRYSQTRHRLASLST